LATPVKASSSCTCHTVRLYAAYLSTCSGNEASTSRLR